VRKADREEITGKNRCNMKKVYILGGIRSYIGIENRMYRHVPAEILGARVLQQAAMPYSKKDINGVIAGNGVGAGGNITRLMMLEAGFPIEIPGFTIDLQCGSGLESIGVAAAKIGCGMGDFYIAGGFESSSTAPRRGYNHNHPDCEKYNGEENWYHVAKFSPGEHRERAMLEGAERVAVRERISCEEMNRWVIRSHQRAEKAREAGVLSKIAVSVLEGCGRDEGIRGRMSEKFLNRLPYILPEGQKITAGNACLTHDGAAFVALCSEDYLREHHLMPKAEFIDIVEVGGNPLESPVTAVTAVERLLQKNCLTSDDIDIFECNEAFAVIDVLFARKYPECVEKYNIFGGALAYGHPFGASGGIITLHAMEALKFVKGSYGVCSIAAAGGVGTAMLVRRDSYNDGLFSNAV